MGHRGRHRRRSHGRSPGGGAAAAFSSYVLYDGEIPVSLRAAPPDWATESRNYAYFDGGTGGVVPAMIVNATALGDGLTMADAVAQIGEDRALRQAAYEIETEDISDEAPVPFTLGIEISQLGADVYSLAWGARSGDGFSPSRHRRRPSANSSYGLSSRV